MLNLGKKSLLFGMKKVYPYATGGDYVYLYEDPTTGKTYRVHEFLSTGTSTLNVEVGGQMDILVVGGGGGGGKGSSSGFGGYAQSSGGGGGAGAMIEHSTKIGNGTYSITVGAGGAKHTGSSGPLVGNDGNSSTFQNTTGTTTISMNASGGGGGAAWISGAINGRTGGSGGGGSVYISSAGTGGVASSYTGDGTKYGNNGGNGYPTGDRERCSGGGGGASENGTNGASNKGGDGGDGRQWLNGRYFSGGGGGGTAIGGSCVQRKGVGGIGGGGNGGSHPDTGGCGDLVATDGTANTGGGGGGGNGWGSASGAGGSGIVIVRYVVAERKLWTPSELTSLKAWWDAADETTITLNGSNVSQWSDKSGNGKHAIQNNSSLQPAYTVGGLNNKNVVTLTQDEMDVTNLVLVNQGHEVYTIATFESTSNNWARLFSFRTTGQSNDYNNSTSWIPILRNAAQTQIGAYQSSGTTYYTITYGTPMLLSSTISNGLTVRVDSVIRATKATSTNLNTTDGLKIGQSLQTGDENWDGLVAEIVFTDELSLTDRQKMEGYLAHKWGLTNNLPSGHPYKYEPPYKVEPEEIVTDGLVLNLDAGDYASYPRSGTTWYDISGNGNNGTLTNGPTYDSANKGSIVTDGTNDYINLGNNFNYTSQSFSINFWINVVDFETNRTDSNQFRPVLFSNGAYQKYGYYCQIDANSIMFITNQSSANQTSTIVDSFVTGVWYNFCVVRNGSSVKIYKNGTEANTTYGTHTNPTSTPTNFVISAYLDGGYAIHGNIKTSSFQIYNRALSSTEITQNFNALRGRYGI